MATNQTTNYQLNQWEPTDAVQRVDFNADNAKVDAALAGLSGSKADSGDLTALSGAVDGLTGRTGALETAVAQRGNCQVLHFTYRGDGSAGKEGPTEVTFPCPPFFFLILGGGCFAYGSKTFMNDLFVNLSTNNAFLEIKWTKNTASFYAEQSQWQFNNKGETYHVFVFYDVGEA